MSAPDFLAVATTLGLAATEASREVVADTIRANYVAGLRRAADEAQERAHVYELPLTDGSDDYGDWYRGRANAARDIETRLRALADEIERGEGDG